MAVGLSAAPYDEPARYRLMEAPSRCRSCIAKFAEWRMASEESVSIRARNNDGAKRMKPDQIRYGPFHKQPATKGFFVDAGDLDLSRKTYVLRI